MMIPNDRHTEGTSIVPAGNAAGRQRYGWLWFVGIALSVAVMTWYPMLGVVCLAMGTRTQAERFGARGLAGGTVVALAVLAGWTAVSGVDATVSAIPLVFVALAIATVMWCGRASVLTVSLVIVAATAFSMAVDGYTAARQGMSLADATCAMLMSVMRASVGTGIEADFTLSAAEPIFETIWPIIYVTSAALDAAVAGVGSALALARPVGAQPAQRPAQLTRFDAPLWAVGLLAVSVLGIGASYADIPQRQLLLTASVTLLLSVRYIFMLQGLGVALGLMNRWRLGCFTRVGIIMIAAWLEMMFFLSIIGLVDVWANFRKLPRDGSPHEANA